MRAPRKLNIHEEGEFLEVGLELTGPNGTTYPRLTRKKVTPVPWDVVHRLLTLSTPAMGSYGKASKRMDEI